MRCTCSACRLPKSEYPLFDAITDDIVGSGRLSQLQLEGVLYASTKHLQILPTGEREHRCHCRCPPLHPPTPSPPFPTDASIPAASKFDTSASHRKALLEAKRCAMLVLMPPAW